jgi:hypothetical protein
MPKSKQSRSLKTKTFVSERNVMLALVVVLVACVAVLLLSQRASAPDILEPTTIDQPQ